MIPVWIWTQNGLTSYRLLGQNEWFLYQSVFVLVPCNNRLSECVSKSHQIIRHLWDIKKVIYLLSYIMVHHRWHFVNSWLFHYSLPPPKLKREKKRKSCIPQPLAQPPSSLNIHYVRQKTSYILLNIIIKSRGISPSTTAWSWRQTLTTLMIVHSLTANVPHHII